MMGGGERDRAIMELRELLVGATVVAVDLPDRGKVECVFKVTAERDGKRTEFHLHATDLGWWLSGTKSVKQGEQPLYTDVVQVFDEMSDHYFRGEQRYEDDGAKVFEALCDVRNRRLGFRHVDSQREWWFSLTAAKKSRWVHEFATPESRAALAAHFGRVGCPPRPSKESSR